MGFYNHNQDLSFDKFSALHKAFVKEFYKKEAHKKGIWHGAVHLIIINNDCTKTLFQKRCKEKKIYPNYWDITVGGHISSKEDSLTTVKRELQEELGLNLDNYNFEEITTVKPIRMPHLCI